LKATSAHFLKFVASRSRKLVEPISNPELH